MIGADIPSLAEVAAWLDDLAARTGNPAYRRAGAALRQPTPGRTPIDDKRALVEVRHLLATGLARTEARACLMVARTLHPTGSAKSIAERLRRKLRGQEK